MGDGSGKGYKVGRVEGAEVWGEMKRQEHTEEGEDGIDWTTKRDKNTRRSGE